MLTNHVSVCFCNQLVIVIKSEPTARPAVNLVDSANANQTLLVAAAIHVLLWRMGLDMMAAQVWSYSVKLSSDLCIPMLHPLPMRTFMSSLLSLACDCDPSGSTAELCDQRSGQCSCRDGVTGRQCDKCYTGYFGFPLCRRCQCNGLADICDPVTGVCLDCREHSTGPQCERYGKILGLCEIVLVMFCSGF